MKRYFITIISFNEKSKKFDKQEFLEEDKKGISRIIMTFKPKKGYDVVNMIVDVFNEDSEIINNNNQLELNI